MKLLDIRITNFRSFAGTQTFAFPEHPGLYFIQGINEVEPKLGANGAGKSTIWEALTWCLYGKTTRGLKAGDVNNWRTGKGTRVEIDFTSDGNDTVLWTMTRTWSPNTWTLSHIADQITDEEVIDLAKDPSNPVLEWLGLEFQPFLNCILMAQGQPMFLDQDAKAQAELFSDVMGLDRWLGYSSKASAKASAQDSINRVLERKFAELTGQLSALGKADLETDVKAWAKQHREKLAELEADYNKKLEDHKTCKAITENLVTQEEDQRIVLAGVRAPNDDLRKRLKVLDSELQDRRTLLAIDMKEIARALEMVEHLEAENECPTCHQVIPKSQRAEQIRKMKERSAKFVTSRDRLAKQVVKTEEEIKSTERSLDRNETAELEAKFKWDDAVAMVADNRRQLQRIDAELDQLEERAEVLQAEVNPYEAMQEQARYDLERVQEKRVATQRLLDDGHHRYSLLSYWVRGFKELRLQLIAEALNELEIEVNSCVAALGLLDWELKFQVDRETKGGNIQRGFSVLVRSPHNRLAVPWEAWSGGEAQRLRLACNMGLSDLIRSRSGASLAVEVWDEPTRELSSQGVQDLLSSLEARAIAEGRQIFIVDHRTHSFGGFAGICTVTKTKTGSIINWET